jgi:hypothetical protein
VVQRVLSMYVALGLILSTNKKKSPSASLLRPFLASSLPGHSNYAEGLYYYYTGVCVSRYARSSGSFHCGIQRINKGCVPVQGFTRGAAAEPVTLNHHQRTRASGFELGGALTSAVVSGSKSHAPKGTKGRGGGLAPAPNTMNLLCP